MRSLTSISWRIVARSPCMPSESCLTASFVRRARSPSAGTQLAQQQLLEGCRTLQAIWAVIVSLSSSALAHTWKPLLAARLRPLSTIFFTSSFFFPRSTPEAVSTTCNRSAQVERRWNSNLQVHVFSPTHTQVKIVLPLAVVCRPQLTFLDQQGQHLTGRTALKCEGWLVLGLSKCI